MPHDTIPAPPLGAAILPDLSRAEYDAIDAVRFSTLKHMATSPLAYRHACDAPSEQTPAMRLGTMAHSLVLGTADADLAVFPGEVRRGRAWEEFEAAHAGSGRTIVKASELAEAQMIAHAVSNCTRARNLLAIGRAECAVVWEYDGQAVRSRLDWLAWTGCGTPWDGPPRIVEIKTTRRMDTFTREARWRHYHAQLALYARGVQAATGWAPEVYIVAAQNEAPWDVAAYRVTQATLAAGWELCATWLGMVRACEASGHWPGVDGGATLDLDVTAYDDATLVVGGEDVTP